MDEKERKKVWNKGLWEILKEGVSQKLLTWRLPSPPLLLPGQLSGLTVIVTGATSGIGLCTARELYMAGANVIMACRNVELANQIADEWRSDASDKIGAKAEVMPLDLLSLSSVRCFVEEWDKRREPLHMLINNAGAYYMKEPQKFSRDGIEQHMHVNHIGPALLTLLLLPSLIKAPISRIVNVNSVAHNCAVVDPSHWISKIDHDNFNDLRAYGESKLAQLMFLKTLSAKLLENQIVSVKSIAVNPGTVNTKLVKQVPVPEWRLFWMLNPAEGARSVIFCATSSEMLNNKLNGGFAYYDWSCKPAKESQQAMDAESCLLVWQKTLDILKFESNYLNQIINC